MEVHPQDLLSSDCTDYHSSNIESEYEYDSSTLFRMKKINNILEKLPLDHLYNEDKECVTNCVHHDYDRFKIPGETLPISTSV